jgi:hypothetical protein
VAALEADLDAENSVFLVIYTSYGWETELEEAAAHIGESFTGGYWSGDVPPVPLSMYPANAVIDMQTGLILATIGDIDDPQDFLQYAAAANND